MVARVRGGRLDDTQALRYPIWPVWMILCSPATGSLDSRGHGSLLKFTTTRTAFARPGPGATPFPDVLALTRPSDSLVSFGEQLRSPLATRLPQRGRLFFAFRPATRASADELLVGDSCPAPRVAGSFRGETWASQVPGPSSSCVPRSYTPPDAASPRLLLLREDRCCLQEIQHPGHPEWS